MALRSLWFFLFGWIFLFLMMSACATVFHAEDRKDRQPAQLQNYNLSAPKEDVTLDFAKLQKFIKSNQIRTIDDFLE
jgi:hypothetical protein